MFRLVRSLAFILALELLVPHHCFGDTVIEDFDPPPDTGRFSSYPGEDVQPTGYDVTNSQSAGGAYSLYLYGNTWKLFDVSSLGLQISGDTVWKLAAYIPSTATVQGFGLSDGSNSLRYGLDCGMQPPAGEPWIPSYAGSRSTQTGFRWFYLPVGRDWIERYGPLAGDLPYLLFFNDEDYGGGQIYLDEIIDVTDSEPKAPSVEAGDDQQAWVGQPVSFQAVVTDPDSGSHTVLWDFGDGETASGSSVSHTFDAQGLYRVEVRATDPDGLRAMDSLSVQVGTPGAVLASMLIGGDCMLARRYEDADENGIPGDGDGSLILPGDQGYGAWVIGYSLRRFQVDHRLVNLETPLTNQGYPHPEKQFVFRSRPDAVAGLTAADFSLVSLANNHTLDYMDAGISQTLQVLDDPAAYSPYAVDRPILHVGGGSDDREAGYCETVTVNGLRIGVIGVCSVLGRPSNQHPFLDAGYDKPGAQWATYYPLRRGLEESERVADLSVVLIHAGSEYDTVPSDWAEAMAHEAVDYGADLVVCHHPHVLQGLELYGGVPIAYSMGNLIFDQKHAFTKRSMLLHVLADHQGVQQLSLVPVYLEEYIPRFMQGQAGQRITAQVLGLSSDLGATLAPLAERAYLLLGHEDERVDSLPETHSAPLAYSSGAGAYVSPILEVDHPWQVDQITDLPGAPASRTLLLGRDVLVFGSFEEDDLDDQDDEGTGWNLASDLAEIIDHSDPYAGDGCLRVRRPSPYTSERRVESRARHPMTRGGLYSLTGYIKTSSSYQTKVDMRWHIYPYGWDVGYNQTYHGPISGTQDWSRFEVFFRAPYDRDYGAVHLCNSRSGGADSYAYFDDVRLIEWTEVSASGLPMDLSAPNGFQYLAVKSSQSGPSTSVEWLLKRWAGTDSDADDLWDWLEDANGNDVVDRGETDPLSSDSDGDGIPDGEEHWFGADRYVTCGWNVDSDGDLYSDDVEIAAFTNPTDPEDHPSGPSPTPTRTPTPPPSPTPTLTPTATPTGTPPSPTPTPEDTPTQGPSPTPAVELDLRLNQQVYRPGDFFQLLCILTNPFGSMVVDQFVILDVYGDYWFWPAWTPELDWRTIFLHSGQQPPETILAFDWPSGAGSAQGILFWGGLLDPDTQELVGLYDRVEFSFTE